MEVLERMALSSAKNPAQLDFATQSSITFKFASDRATNPFRPPMLSAHLSPSMASSTHNIEGVLMVSPAKMPEINLPPLLIWKILGSGRAGVNCSNRCTARGLSAIMPWPPSPPNTFCQDQVTTSSFCQGICIANTADVASQIARP